MSITYTHLIPVLIKDKNNNLIFIAKRYNHIADEHLDIQYHSNFKWQSDFTIEYEESILINDFELLVEKFNPRFKRELRKNYGTFVSKKMIHSK